MRKLTYFLIFTSLFFFYLSLAGEIKIEPPVVHPTLEDLIKAIIRFLRTLGIAIIPIVVIIGGYYIMTAGGDPQKVNTGKNIIIYALIGLGILLLADVLVDVIKGIIGVK